MKSNKPARKHSSTVISQLLDETSPVERTQITNRMLLAVRLDDLIKLRGWSKSRFATIVGKSPSEITKWLSGTQNFTVDTLTEIAVAFNMSIGELLASPSPLVVYKLEMVINMKEPAQSEPYMTTITSKKKSSTYIGDFYLNTILSLSSPNLAKS